MLQNHARYAKRSTIKDNKPMYMHYNLDTRARLEHFFAQCYVEVGGNGFRLEEGLEYTTAKNLKRVFPSKFKDDNAKKADELIALKTDKEKAIANYVYSDRNGNQGGDDGYNFKGRGIIQLTGKSNYTQFQTYYNNNNPKDKKDFLNNEEHRKELLTNGRMALLSAVWFWNGNNLYKYSDNDNGDMESVIIQEEHKGKIENKTINVNSVLKIITQRINGKKLMHIKDRQNNFARIKQKGIFNDFK